VVEVDEEEEDETEVAELEVEDAEVVCFEREETTSFASLKII
jgi:hypothetical protein